MTTATTVPHIDRPGVYQMDDRTYHADPVPGGSLSVSGARQLLPPSCPARFAYQREHRPTPKPEYDLGHAAHLEVLGAGPELVVIEAADWRTKAAREARDAAHAEGRVPLLPHQLDQVKDMALELVQHPIAGELLHPTRMVAEQSVFWIDTETGIWRRARLDAVSRPDAAGDHFVVDYKTTRAADLHSISRAMHFYGYAMQADWYLDAGIEGHLIEPEGRFLFVFQEVDPPYLVTVVEPDSIALSTGRRRNRQAIETYRDCVESGQWPGHVPPTDIPLVSVPEWVERQHTATDDEWETL